MLSNVFCMYQLQRALWLDFLLRDRALCGGLSEDDELEDELEEDLLDFLDLRRLLSWALDLSLLCLWDDFLDLALLEVSESSGCSLRYSSSTSRMMFFISKGLFMMASRAFNSSFWMAYIGSSCNRTKSSHLRLVASSWKTCLFSFLGFGLAVPVRYCSLFFCCCSLLPQSYIQSMRSRWERGISPASTWILFISWLCCSSCSFLTRSFCFLMTCSWACWASQTCWMFFMDPGCHTFLFRQSSPITLIIDPYLNIYCHSQRAGIRAIHQSQFCHQQIASKTAMHNQTKQQLSRLIEFAIAERKYQHVIELVKKLISLSTHPHPELYVQLAKAYLECNQPTEVIECLGQAQQRGANIAEIGLLQTRAYLECGCVQESELAFSKLLKANPQFKQVLTLSNAIEAVKGRDPRLRLSAHEQHMLEKMKGWLYQAGAQYDKLKVVNMAEGYRGVLAIKSIKKNEAIVYVPASEMITLEMAKNNHFSQSIMTSKLRLLSPKHTFIAIYLLEERSKPESKWKPYLDLLPNDHTCFPINYSKQELEMLVGSPVLFMIAEKVKDLKKDYETVVKCDQNFVKYAFKDFCWARTIVGSRIFGLTISGVKTEALVPFADMLNHRIPQQTTWNYLQELQGFVIQSRQDIELGQQVFDSYGRKCNSRFLLNYGFIVEDNPDNEITLRMVMAHSDPLAPEKLAMMGENPKEDLIVLAKLNLNMNNNKFYELMGCLRFAVVQDEPTLRVLEKISGIEQRRQTYKWSRTPPVSLDNQIRAWEKFLGLCKHSLATYPNDIEADHQLLASDVITQNVRNIVKVRMGEKHILKEFIEMGAQIKAILSAEALVDKLEEQKGKLYYRYLSKILLVMPGVNRQQLRQAVLQEPDNSELDEEYNEDIG